MNYTTIVADPPWNVKRPSTPMSNKFAGRTTGIKSVPLEYPTMSLEEISALPIEELAETNAHLYLWTINRYVEDAYDVARAWGFTPKTLLTWGKAPMGLGPGGAYSQTSEHVLFCRRGRDVRKQRENSTWWQWKRGRHSAKPEAFQDMVERVSPGPYLELFARRARPGWDVWGNEVDSDLEIEV